MKKGIYILAVILFLLGTASILAGLGVINIISSIHHLRYELGGALVDLLAISGSILITVNDLKTKLRRIAAFFRVGILEDRKFASSESLFVALFLGILGIAAFVLIVWITPYGSGVNPNSVTYINLAKNILSGKGYSINAVPQTHFPPFYSMVLAATNLTTNNFVQAARILNAILFGINIGLIALAVYLTTGRHFLPALFATFFFLSSAPLLELHAGAYSEPLFISFSLASIILLRLYINNPKLSLLISASLFLGFAFITRYIGIAFLPAVLAIVLLSEAGPRFGRKVWNTIICLILSCVPLSIFFVRNILVAGSATDRMFFYHPLPLLRYVTKLWDVAIIYFAPIALPASVTLVAVGLLAAFLVTQILILFKRHGKNISWRSGVIIMPAACLLFSVSYLLFLYLSISFMDASTPVDVRILSPILCILIVGGFSAVWAVSKTLQAPLLWWGFLLCAVLSILIKMPDAIQSAAALREYGFGYTSRLWQTSETVAFVKLQPEKMIIYTNGVDVLGFLTGKNTINVPYKTFPITMQTNSQYNKQMNEMCSQIEAKGALLVYLNQFSWRWYFPPLETIASSCKLPISHSFSDGIVFGNQSK